MPEDILIACPWEECDDSCVTGEEPKDCCLTCNALEQCSHVCDGLREDELTMSEYREYRCCMCPNLDIPESKVCPPGPLKEEATPCRFVKVYVDDRGWQYRVMGGLGESNFKGRYNKPGKLGWKCMRQLEWRKSFDEAQSDLNMLAKKNGWREV